MLEPLFGRKDRHPARPRAVLVVEGLEERRVPATFVVASLADAGAGSLRAAITQANSTPGADVIVFAPGLTGGVIGLRSSLPAISEALTVNGPGLGSRSVTIDARGNGRVLDIVDTAESVTLRNLTLTGGNTLGDGGGLQNAGASTTLVRVALVRNQAGDAGGGVDNDLGAALTLRRCLVADNSAGNDGGGVQAGERLTMLRSRVLRNTTSGTGGGVHVGGEGHLALIFACTIADNVAEVGGGLEVQFGAGANVIGSTISGNRAPTGAGGGIRVASGGSAGILNTTVAFNHAGGHDGGGGVSIDGEAGTVTMINATIVANVDTAGNFTAGGGGIGKEDGSSTLRLFNSVVAGNIVAAGFVDLSNDAIDQGGNNFVGGDPRLGFLKPASGPTFTMVPLADSPLIDAGDNRSFTFDPATDQRGLARVIDGNGDGTATIDIGAVEFVRRQPRV
jgi:hypothetical protein